MSEDVSTPAPLSIEHAILALDTMLGPRRAVFKRPVRISIGTLEGPAFCIDTRARELIAEGWVAGADLSVITNRQTLSDMLLGEIDVNDPRPDHVLVWGGDPGIWSTLARSLTGKTSAFAAHLSALGAKGAKS